MLAFRNHMKNSWDEVDKSVWPYCLHHPSYAYLSALFFTFNTNLCLIFYLHAFSSPLWAWFCRYWINDNCMWPWTVCMECDNRHEIERKLSWFYTLPLKHAPGRISKHEQKPQWHELFFHSPTPALSTWWGPTKQDKVPSYSPSHSLN